MNDGRGLLCLFFLVLPINVAISGTTDTIDCDGTDEEICEQARTDGFSHGDPGGVICCDDGRRIVCTWPENIPPEYNPPGNPCLSEILYCLEAHEQTHADDPLSHCQGGRVGGDPSLTGNEAACAMMRAECQGLEIQLECLTEYLCTEETSYDCRISDCELITDWIDYVTDIMNNNHHCDGSLIMPDGKTFQEYCCEQYDILCGEEDKK